ncbi:hypothetical protein AAVH_01042 [Aphelenchoides avenae]|nr:hypothetical protein AAVH_01042 [Aphelenchus avenae]
MNDISGRRLAPAQDTLNDHPPPPKSRRTAPGIITISYDGEQEDSTLPGANAYRKPSRRTAATISAAKRSAVPMAAEQASTSKKAAVLVDLTNQAASSMRTIA